MYISMSFHAASIPQSSIIIHNHPPTYTWPVSHPYLAYVSEIQARAPKHSAKRCRMSCEIWCIHTAEMVVLRSYKIMYIRYTYIYIYIYIHMCICILYIYIVYFIYIHTQTTYDHMIPHAHCQTMQSFVGLSFGLLLGRDGWQALHGECRKAMHLRTVLKYSDILWYLVTSYDNVMVDNLWICRSVACLAAICAAIDW